MAGRSHPVRTSICLASLLSLMSLTLAASATRFARTDAESEDWAARFDRMDKQLNNGMGYCASLNTKGELAWSEAYIMRAYVEMYRATRDRAYLDSLIEHFDQILANRDDAPSRHASDSYRNQPMAGWGSSSYSDNHWHVWAVHTGMICQGPVEFIRAVRGVKALRRDYGAKATQYLKRIEECVAAHDSEWRDGPGPDEGYYVDPGIGPLPLNQQNALGSVIVELYRITGDQKHHDRANRLAAYFRRRMRRQPDGSFEWAYWPKPNAPGAGSEDISHAGLNIDFAVRCRWAHIGFNQKDMAALARTWTQHVRRAPGVFADTVAGTGASNTHVTQAIGSWLDLCVFDHSILADARKVVSKIGEGEGGGAAMFAVAKLARWEHELAAKSKHGAVTDVDLAD